MSISRWRKSQEASYAAGIVLSTGGNAVSKDPAHRGLPFWWRLQIASKQIYTYCVRWSWCYGEEWEVKIESSITLSCYARSGKASLSRDQMEMTEWDLLWSGEAHSRQENNQCKCPKEGRGMERFQEHKMASMAGAEGGKIIQSLSWWKSLHFHSKWASL